MKRWFWTLALAGLLSGITGCTPKYNVEVYMSPKFVETMKIYPSMEVDVAGLNINEVDRIKGIPTDKYFEYDSLLRKGLDKCTLTFSADSVEPKLVTSGNAVWKKFAAKDAEQLLLIANIPGVNNGGEKDASKDMRKLIVPMKASFFASTLYFELSPFGVLQLNGKPKGYAKPVDITAKDTKK